MRAQLISLGFGVAALITALASLLGPLNDSITIYRAIAFFILAGFCFGAAVFEQIKAASKIFTVVCGCPTASNFRFALRVLQLPLRWHYPSMVPSSNGCLRINLRYPDNPVSFVLVYLENGRVIRNSPGQLWI